MIDVLTHPVRSTVVNLLGLPIGDRPAFFDSLLAQSVALRARSGRPHWLIADEAHHLVPAGWQPKDGVSHELEGLLLVTVHPEALAPDVLRGIDLVVAVGSDTQPTMEAVARVLQRPTPSVTSPSEPGEALAWRPRQGDGQAGPEVASFRPAEPSVDRLRHRRKYARGELGPDKSFWFRGPDDRLNLRAQNLSLFLQLGDGVDDATWLHHLREGDYSRWINESISDPGLATEIAEIEEDAGATAAETRRRIREAIEARYTAPAD